VGRTWLSERERERVSERKRTRVRESEWGAHFVSSRPRPIKVHDVRGNSDTQRAKGLRTASSHLLNNSGLHLYIYTHTHTYEKKKERIRRKRIRIYMCVCVYPANGNGGNRHSLFFIFTPLLIYTNSLSIYSSRRRCQQYFPLDPPRFVFFPPLRLAPLRY